MDDARPKIASRSSGRRFLLSLRRLITAPRAVPNTSTADQEFFLPMTSVDGELASILRTSPPSRTRSQSLGLPLPAFVIKDFLSPDECTQLMALAEKHGFETFDVEFRRSSRALIDGPSAAQALFERLEPHLSRAGLDNGPKGGWKRCSGLNEMLRFLRYRPGDYFKPHTDGRYVRSADDPRGAGDTSLLTLMLYLNQPEKGGETTFMPAGFVNKRNQLTHSIRPEAGLCLVFDHDLLHEGAMLREGVKYAVRTDVMYSRAPLPQP